MNTQRILSSLLAVVTALMMGPAMAEDGGGQARPIFSEPLPNVPGKSLIAVEVLYPPGRASPPHRHAPSAFIYAYVVSGRIVSQVGDGPERIYSAGEGFYEPPGAHHRVSRNASNTEPAKLLAVFIVDSGDHPLTIPDAQPSARAGASIDPTGTAPTGAAPTGAAKEPAPGDRAYVAEDPRLTRLIGSPAPTLSLQALDGSLISLADTYGKKPVYLKLWASYCVPCRAQMPKFEKIYETVGDRMQVIAVNAGVGDDPAKVAAFATRTGMHMPIAIDDGSLGGWLKMQGTPVHLIIGRDGRIAFAGHQDGAELDAAIQRVLDSPQSRVAVPAVAVDPSPKVGLGDRVPALTLTRPDGSTMQWRGGATGHPSALLFTAVWCEDYLKDIEPQTAQSCRRTRGEVVHLAQSGSVEWLGVVTHLWTTPQDLAQYRERTRQSLPYAVDTEGAAFRAFGIRRFPAVALIDASGRLRRIIGPDEGDLAEAERQIQ